MSLSFRKISEFNQGLINDLLIDAYSFDPRFREHCGTNWQEFDSFFFNNLQIADKCGFITTLNDEVIGFASWDPRNMPEYVAVGHNCIVSKFKGRGYGRIQLQEAIERIKRVEVKKIIVSTNEALIPAQRMYESAGFKFDHMSANQNNTDFAGDMINYVFLNS